MSVLLASLAGVLRGPRLELGRAAALALTIGLCSLQSGMAAELEAGQVTPRTPQSDAELKAWLENMIVHHGFSTEEVTAATGLADAEVREAVDRFGLEGSTGTAASSGELIKVLPYPGGRHPRTGFLDGAVDPQRETKVSIFTPWDPMSYVVLDVPEAIFSNLGLIYLAHTHIPTVWDQQEIELPKLEWVSKDSGVLTMERRLPNGITFGTEITPRRDGVMFEQWIRNGTDQTLTDLHVQNCAMLSRASGFEHEEDRMIVSESPYTALRSETGDRWIIMAFEPCRRLWANPPVPCIHSDPYFPDCAPGETTFIRGWLSFYEGEDVRSEFKRLETLGWGHSALAGRDGSSEL